MALALAAPWPATSVPLAAAAAGAAALPLPFAFCRPVALAALPLPLPLATAAPAAASQRKEPKGGVNPDHPHQITPELTGRSRRCRRRSIGEHRLGDGHGHGSLDGCVILLSVAASMV